MILLFVTLVMLVGSVAATDTTSNQTTEILSPSNNVVDISTTTSTITKSSETTTTSKDSTNTKNISKVSNTTTKTSTSSSSTVKSDSTKKLNTNIKVYDITSTKGSVVTLKSVITQNNGSYVKNGTVVYKINGKTIGNTTVSNGGAKLTYTIPSSWKNLNYTITAVYLENSFYGRSTSNSTLKLKSNLSTIVSVPDISAVQGDTVTIKTVITTKDGSYVKTGKVAFKINGKTIGTSYVSNGGAKITYTIPSNWSNSKYTITVVYGKNDYYKNSTGTGFIKLNAKTKTKIAINTTSVVTGRSTTFVTTLTDSSGKLVSNGKVAFKINGKTIGTTRVSKGVAKLNYTIPSSWNGKYNISVVYGGYGQYKSATKTTTLTVSKPVNTKITINSTSAVKGKSTTLIATVTDENGKLVPSGKAVFKFNGKTIGTAYVTKGVAKLNYTIPSSWSGTYNITFVYGGSGKYLSSKVTKKFTVTSSSSFVVPDGYSSYVKETKNCEVSNSKIKSLAESLTKGTTSVYQAAVKIFNYVRDSISYSSYYDTRYGAVGTLNRKYGNCVDQSHLLIALMRSVNIPARYCHATCYFRSGLVTGHVWAQVYINGKWYSCDTTSSRNSFNSINNWYKSSTVYRYTSLYF